MRVLMCALASVVVLVGCNLTFEQRPLSEDVSVIDVEGPIEERCGTVFCSESQTCCVDACIEIQEDVSNCGGCGVTCGSGETCVEGACRCGDTVASGNSACGAIRECCSGVCLNVKFDPRHCGGCDQDCGSGNSVCIGGGCQCDAGFGSCRSSSTELCTTPLLGDPSNCGECDRVCGGDSECLSGNCSCNGALCAPGSACCGVSIERSTCLDIKDNPQNCGGCDAACGGGESCADGQCQCGTGPPCAAAEFCCKGACVSDVAQCPCNGGAPCDSSDTCCSAGGGAEVCADVLTEVAHCGSCGVQCRADQACVGGSCVCQALGQTDCNGVCVDPASFTTSEHCGLCNNTCDGGGSCCGGTCANTDQNALHCGACGVVCGTGLCSDGLCNCGTGAVDLLGDVDHCGGCGASCPTLPFQTALCEAGVCGAGSCVPGHSSCDSDSSNGCESDLSTSSTHCGSCFSSCEATEICAQGQCVSNSAIVQLDAGYRATCAVRGTGAVLCWGDNSDGQLGDGSFSDHRTPELVIGVSNGVQVATCGGDPNHSCVALRNGLVQCWGTDGAGQIGNGPPGTGNKLPTPEFVLGLTDAVQVDNGEQHSCALQAQGTVKCWGQGAGGRLGYGSTVDTDSPVAVQSLSDAIQIGLGQAHSCALRSNGQVACWGVNDSGQLGIGTSSGSFPSLQLVNGISDAVQLAVGRDHGCVLRSGGTVMCWGRNDKGQLGDGTTTERQLPVVTQGLQNVVEIAAGGFHTCARLSDNHVECWGWNAYGQLGDSTNVRSSFPVAVQGISTAVELATGNIHSCARHSNNTLSCWGHNGQGQLGNGLTSDSRIPVGVNLP